MEYRKKKSLVAVTFVGALLALIISISLASAYQNLCLTHGQTIPSEENPRFTCHHDQCINICVTDNLFPTNPSFCRDLGGCEFLDGETSVDGEPPEVSVNSPVEGGVYNSRKVLFDLSFDEPSSISYLDTIHGRGRWKRICSNCDDSYSKSISLKDGENNVTFRVTDRRGNSAFISRSFYVDSSKPRINRYFPKRGFASGHFEVQYTEANLETVELTYGNFQTGYNTTTLQGCASGSKIWCDIHVDLDAYDGQTIDYSFRVTDIAGTLKESKPRSLAVDTTFPVLHNPDSFWEQGVDRYEKYIYFTFNITELNFDEIAYYDHSDSRPRWKRLCSRLKEGICEKRKSFSKGKTHILDLQILDDAGNAISTERIDFYIPK